MLLLPSALPSLPKIYKETLYYFSHMLFNRIPYTFSSRDRTHSIVCTVYRTYDSLDIGSNAGHNVTIKNILRRKSLFLGVFFAYQNRTTENFE